MLLIGLGHKARQGKNTAALGLLEAAPISIDARLYAYATALRQEVRSACIRFGHAAALIESFKEAGLMPEWVRDEAGKQRTLYQWWGTDYRRKQDPDYWVKRLFAQVKKDAPDLAIVTDVRFPNEAESIKSAGGVLIKVIRTTPPDLIVPAHPSEDALNGYTGWDYTLEAATVTELKRKSHTLYLEIEKRVGYGG